MCFSRLVNSIFYMTYISQAKSLGTSNHQLLRQVCQLAAVVPVQRSKNKVACTCAGLATGPFGDLINT